MLTVNFVLCGKLVLGQLSVVPRSDCVLIIVMYCNIFTILFYMLQCIVDVTLHKFSVDYLGTC